MAKENIKINDFNMFYDILHSLGKMSDGVKLLVNECGLTVYAKNDYSKCELTSNAITSEKEISFCLGDISSFHKILTTIKNLYVNDFSEVKMYFETPFIKIESKKFKTKIATVEEQRIFNFLGTKVHTDLTPQLEFTTNTNIIKSINSHSFIFNDSSSPRIYLTIDSEMENNMVFAKIGNESNDLANSVTLELGMLNSGYMDDKKCILDFGRLNILNMVPSDEIKVWLAKERPVLVSNIKKNGNNGTFFNINIYVFLMVK